MGLFTFGGKPPDKARHRRPKRKGNAWIDKVAKTEASQKMVEDLQTSNPVIQAAIVQNLTGIEVKPEHIKIQTPKEAFEAKLMTDAIKIASADAEFVESIKDAMVDSIYAGSGKGRYRRGGRGGQEFDESQGPYPYGPMGYPQNDPLAMVDQVEMLKDRLGGGGFSKSVAELAPLLVPLATALMGKSAPTPIAAAGPTLIGVEIDGRMVEMTREGYEIYKRQRAQIAAHNGNGHTLPPGHEAAVPVTVPPSPAAPAPAAAAAPATLAAAEPPPEPAPAAPVEPYDLGMMRPQVLLLAQELARDIEAMTAQQYAAHLRLQADEGDPNARVAVDFLCTMTCDEAMGLLQRIRHYDDLRPYIERIEKKRDYLKDLIDQLKSMAEEK